MVVIIICKKAPFEEGEGWVEDKQKFKIGICIVRVIVLFFLMSFIYFNVFSLYKDTYGLLIKSEEPIVATHTVKGATASLGGAWFIGLTVTIEEGGVREKISLMFSGGVKVNQTYEFTYLPRTKKVLEYRLVE